MTCSEGLPGEHLLSLKRTWQYTLGLQSWLLNNALWRDETKVEIFDHNALLHIWYKRLIPTVKHGGGGVMIWAFFYRHLADRPCWLQLKLSWNQIMQQDKHSNKSTTKWLKKKKIKVMQCAGQNLDICFTEMQNCQRTLQKN